MSRTARDPHTRADRGGGLRSGHFPDRALTHRVGAFQLHEDGTLDGDATCLFWGHSGIALKDSLDDLDEAGREQDWTRQVRLRMPSAELSAIRFENLDGPDLPVAVHYHLRVPEFAAVTGRRLVFHPAVFQLGRAALFSDERRTHPVDFHYAWSEYDSVLITLPDGFELDHADAPPNHSIGDAGEYAVRIGVANDGRLLVFRREFSFNEVRFRAKPGYQLKQTIDFYTHPGFVMLIHPERGVLLEDLARLRAWERAGAMYELE